MRNKELEFDKYWLVENADNLYKADFFGWKGMKNNVIKTMY